MNPSFQISVYNPPARVPLAVIAVRGELDAVTSPQLEKAAAEAFGQGAGHLLLDLANVSFMGSAGLRALVAIDELLRPQSGPAAGGQRPATTAASFKSPYLKLLSPSPAVARTLRLSGFEMVFDIFDDRQAAVESFASSRGEATRTTADESPPHFPFDAGLPDEALAALQDKRFLIVMGSYPGKRFMYERARQLGARLVVLDGPGHWTQEEVGGLFEDFIEVDLQPADTLADRAMQAVRQSNLHFDGAATFEEFAGPLAALLAQGLKRPGHPFLSTAYCRDKTLTREVCIEAGIPSPRFYRIRGEEDLVAAAAHVGFPAVLKPVSGASSVSTYRVDEDCELARRYQQTMGAVRGHLKSSGVHSNDEEELIWAKGFDMTLEQFLDGEEFDVDVLLSRGEVAYAGVGRDLPQPYLREVGSRMPADFPEEKQAEMIAFTARVLQAMGFSEGSFHVELKYTSEGPRLIEVNARIGGAYIAKLHEWVWGVDLVGYYLLTRLGLPIHPRKAVQPLTCIATSDLPCPISGVITHTDYLAEIDDPHVILKRVYVTPGQTVIGPDRGVPDTLGEIFVAAESIEAASTILDELLARIQFPIIPA